MFRNRHCLLATSIAVSALLAGCGGGGGGDSSATANPTPAGGTISSASAVEATAQSFSAMEDLNSQGSNGTSVATGVSIEASTSGVIGASLQQVYAGVKALPPDNLATGVTTSRTVTCAGGGAIVITAALAVSGRISNSDTLSFTATNCAEGGNLLNGRFDVGFSNLSGTIGSDTAWSGRLAFNFIDLSVQQSSGRAVRVNGDLALSAVQTGFRVLTASASGASLQLNLTRSDGTIINRTLTNYALNASLNGNTSTFRADFTLTGNSTSSGAFSYTVRTITPFQATGTANPSTGSLTVAAADGSRATLTALDSTNVRIDLDQNGDGVTDATINTTWAELRRRI